ncbi:MAG: TIGR01777 family protein, partial [Desulfovibrio sp.]|nr:TIGR01777 family protein [Desulfovibrio sp.]
MRVVITGGTGFIGRILSRILAGQGHEVVVLTRRPRPAPAGKSSASVQDGRSGGTVEHVGWDGRTDRGWGHLAEYAAVVNLAGENIAAGRWSAEKKRDIVESRLASGAAVVRAAARARPRVVVQASAVGYYGNRGEQVLEESAPPGRGFLAETAVRWEESTRAVEDMGVRRVVVRTGVVLGTEGGAFPRLLTPFRLGLGGPVGDGRAWFPWIHAQDEVRAIAFLLERPDAAGPFNLAAPGIVTNKEFSDALGKALRRPTVLRVPALALRLALGEMADAALLASLRVTPARLSALGFAFRYPELGSALADL